uniref:Peptidase metallopeptidase domain-containing protein n=1 Tax=Globodera rostochiensis TaxID=31243 RepID=A0A914H581_GLORO
MLVEDGGGRSFWNRRSMRTTTFFISIFLLFGTFSLFNAFSTDENNGSDDSLGDDDIISQLISDNDAKGYLNRFGYIDSSPSQEGTDEEPRVYAQQQHRKTEDMIGGDLTLDSIRSAVRKFQEFAGLPTTGNLDNRTRKKMAQPRCGMQDVQMLTSADYVLKWRKRRVTYQLMHATDDIPEHMQKQALQLAFDAWSRVVPLDFSEASGYDTPDVKVLFARRSHGDPWPFDGRGGVLAHATFPQDGKLHFDDDENWVFMDGNKIGNHRFTDMYWVALHEIGHVLGLSHSNIETAIMAPFYQDPRDLVDWRGNYKTPELTQDDTRAAQQIYGKRYGRIGTSSSADRSDRNPSVGGGRRKSATYDDRQGGFWSQLGKMFSSEDGNDANINNNDDRPTTHHGSNGRYHNRRDHHHRHNYEREYAEMDNSATGHFAKIHIANMLFAAIFTFIMAKLFIL